jgi:hypothetical protein
VFGWGSDYGGGGFAADAVTRNENRKEKMEKI